MNPVIGFGALLIPISTDRDLQPQEIVVQQEVEPDKPKLDNEIIATSTEIEFVTAQILVAWHSVWGYSQGLLFPIFLDLTGGMVACIQEIS